MNKGELAAAVQTGDNPWVRLRDGLRISLVEVYDLKAGIFIGKFIPCAKNARTYKVMFNEVAEFIGKKD